MKFEKKILIIDDDRNNILALNAVLKSKGFDCVSATSASTGIEMLKANSVFGLVLMDMMMPDIDGYEAMKMLHSLPSLSSIPIVAVTAQAMTGDKERCLNAGASGYVSKPINIEELETMIHQLMN
ncbi:MAG: response regulator [Ginsengibacter sp.]|jgi:CheY-like chemotaxis protein